ncbi:hypothetical protein, partial [Micromonospora foliorum]|uniref:hypothetical protein n=1 Tax=Micromonospora foliorum TaxID=2911210 RepID=UPI001EE8F375
MVIREFPVLFRVDEGAPSVDGGQLGSAGAGTTGGAEAAAPVQPAPDVGRVAPAVDGHPAGGAETDALARTPGVSVIAGGG